MKEKPNVIWIVADQLRYHAIGVNEAPNVHTPNIDLLALTGTIYDQAYSGAPHCCPFRGSMLTSVYPNKCVPDNGCKMPVEFLTIADIMNGAGYETGYFGKWHLDGGLKNSSTHYVPKTSRGRFHTWIGFEAGNNHFNKYVHGHDKDEEIDSYKLDGYETDEMTRLFIDFINKQTGPFFGVLSIEPPHPPNLAPAMYMGRHSPADIELRSNVPHVRSVESRARQVMAGMYAQIENLDWNIGRIMEALRMKGLADDTHIVIFSDHGEMAGSHGMFGKTTPYEESVRIPMIVSSASCGKLPGMKKAGRCNVLMNHVDIAPTTLGLCGIDVPMEMQGRDLSGGRLAAKELPVVESLYFQHIAKEIHSSENVEYGWRGIITDDGWKYAAFEGQPWLMFHLTEDPYEEVNLVYTRKYSQQKQHLQELLQQWIDKTQDDFQLKRG